MKQEEAIRNCVRKRTGLECIQPFDKRESEGRRVEEGEKESRREREGE